MRPSFNDYFMAIARVVSTRATCPKRSVGVVVVDQQHHIVSTGYNGAPPGMNHCLQVGCLEVDGHCRRAIHADANAIVHARGSLEGCTMYIWGGSPCWSCAQLIAASGIKEVVCVGVYDDWQRVQTYLAGTNIAISWRDPILTTPEAALEVDEKPAIKLQ